MKNILKNRMIITLVSLFVYSGSFAEEATVVLPAADYKAILKQLDALQKRVDFLEAGQPVRAIAQPSVAEQDGLHKKIGRDINEIYDTLDELETKKLQNKLNLGAELRTRVDTFRAENYTYVDLQKYMENLAAGTPYLQAGRGAAIHQDSNEDYNNWSNRFRININARITDSMTFHARISGGGYWADSDSDDSYFGGSQVFHGGSNGGVGFERFYVDWIPAGLPFPFALTIGRQPSSEGPPFEFRENNVRQSTYPALLFNGIADGLVATLGLDRYTGLDNSGFRFAYGKAYHSDSNSLLTPFPFLDDDEAGDSDIYAGFFESAIPGIRDSLVVFSYVRILAMPAILAGPLEPTYHFSNENLGDMELWGIHLQGKDLWSSGLDFFFSYAGNRSLPDDPADIGLLSWDNIGEQSGHALYSGMRYTVPFAPLNNPKLGFEFNHGSKYWHSMTMGFPDPFNKLATRGTVYDAYYIQPVNKHLFFRAGYMRVEYDYTGSGSYLGEPEPSAATLQDIYLLMDVRF